MVALREYKEMFVAYRALLNNHKANKQKKRKEIWLIVDLRMSNDFFAEAKFQI